VRVKRLTEYVEPAQLLPEMISNENKAVTVKAVVLEGTSFSLEKVKKSGSTACERRALNVIIAGRTGVCCGCCVSYGVRTCECI